MSGQFAAASAQTASLVQLEGDRQGEVFMTDIAFSAGALDANRAGRLGPDQLRDLQAGVRYRRSGLVGHLLHSGDTFAQDVANGQVASVDGAITKKIWRTGGGGGEAPVLSDLGGQSAVRQ